MRDGHRPAFDFVASAVAVASVFLTMEAARAVTLDWVEIGDSGNACDVQTQGCFGTVSAPKGHRISRFEVTNAEYVEFLNAIGAEDLNGVYDPGMGSVDGAIDRTGASPSYVYALKSMGLADEPVNFVSYANAQRFANWLHNGQPAGPQNGFTTEDGAYTFSGPGPGGQREPDAEIFLPSEDEWYKAAYFDRFGASYFDYPAQSDTTLSCTLTFSFPNGANCNGAVLGPTDVGSYTMSDGPYGTRDQGGNMAEWTETSPSAGQRVVRGGGWQDPATAAAAASRASLAEATTSAQLGFRVAAAGTTRGLDVFYDFEGGDGDVATDKLTADGAQDGRLYNQVAIQDINVPQGSQAAQFDVPDADTVPPFSTFEVGGSTELGDCFSVALHVDNRDSPIGYTRVFSSYDGTGPIQADRMLLDYDPSGVFVPGGLRFILNGQVVDTFSPPPALLVPGYHHFAVTVDDGLVRLYLDGAEVATGDVGLGYSHAENLRVGEDPHDAGGTDDEQLVGFVDDLIVIDRRLTALEIAALATTPVTSVVSMISADYVAYYDFEGDLQDQYTVEGAHDGVGYANASVDSNPVNAWSGSGSGRLDDPIPISFATPPFSTFEVGGSAGLQGDFTIALQVDNTEWPQDLTRLVSSFGGTGSVGFSRILLDYDPSGALIPGIRLVLGGDQVTTTSVPAAFGTPGYHHVAATFESGTVRLFADGAEVASSFVGLAYANSTNLRIGEDPHDFGGTAEEQLIGHVDEVVVIQRALSPPEVLALSSSVASSVVTPQPGEYAVYFDFEGDGFDRFLSDGHQVLTAHVGARISSDPAKAFMGSGSGELALPAPQPFSRIGVGPVGNLGESWTMSATIDYPRAGYNGGGVARLFSSWPGTGPTDGHLAFQVFNTSPQSMLPSIVLPDGTSLVGSGPGGFNIVRTVTATYDDGDLTLYTDGVLAGITATSGDVDLGGLPLFIGEDADGPVDQNFIGTMDDVFILSRALSPAEVLQAHQEGAAIVIPEPAVPLSILAGCGLLMLLRSRRSG